MSDKPLIRGATYFHVAAALLVVMIVLGRFVVRDSTASPALADDVLGFWLPILAVSLLVLPWRRAHAQAMPWVAGAFAALAFVATVAIFWRGNLPMFMAAVGSGSLLLLAGLALRTKRVHEPLSRPDRFALIAVAGGLGIGVALAEGGLRLTPGLFNPEVQRMLRADPGNYGIAHPYVGHLHTPNNTIELSGRDFHAVHHVDGMGFRNAWPWPDRAEIVAVGDSLTFGYGVTDGQAWPCLLERAVAPNRVINLGLIGAGPQQYLRVFQTFGTSLRPKLVLVGVFAQNDFWDANIFDRWLQSGAGGNFMVWRDFGRGPHVTFNARDPLGSLERVLRASVLPTLRGSYTYNLLRALRGGAEGPLPAPPRVFQFADGSRLQLFESDYLAKFAAAQPDHREFRLVLDALEQIDTLAKQQGARTLMVLQPGKEQVYLPLLGDTREDPTSALRAALDRLGIEYLDLAPGFRDRAVAGERLFFEVDGHPNQAGYDLIARLVQAHIRGHAARYGLIVPTAR